MRLYRRYPDVARAVGSAIASEIGRDEVVLFAGLALTAYGCWLVWPPAAYLVPGLVLVWMALPSRTAFIERPPAPDAKSRRAD